MLLSMWFIESGTNSLIERHLAMAKTFGYTVRLLGEIIDTVYYNEEVDVDDVYDGLVHHDGYDPCITVTPEL